MAPHCSFDAKGETVDLHWTSSAGRTMRQRRKIEPRKAEPGESRTRVCLGWHYVNDGCRVTELHSFDGKNRKVYAESRSTRSKPLPVFLSAHSATSRVT